MNHRRSLIVLAAFLVMSGSVMGSEPEKRRQVRWGELGKLIGGKKVALQLVDGARVEGRVRKVEAPFLTIKVKKSSNPAAYSKGRTEFPREAVSRIEVRSSILVRGGRAAGRIGLSLAAFVGAYLVSGFALVGPTASESEPSVVQVAAAVGIATGAAVLTYRAYRSKAVTLIEIVPDPPTERAPKPTNNNQSSRPKQDASSLVGESLPMTSESLVLPAFKHSGIGAAVPSLVEKSSSERLHRQARRAVMRQGIPFHLSSLAEVQSSATVRHAED